MTLADLLTSVATLGLVMGGTFLVLDESHRAYTIGAARVESQQSARIALTRFARDVRTAGSGLAPTFAAISVAEPARIVFHRDVNDDGVIAGTRETITWRLDGTILRRDAGGGAQPIINGARSLSLSYYDADGALTTVADDVRAIGISLTTEPVDVAAPGVQTMVTTLVRLRNR